MNTNKKRLIAFFTPAAVVLLLVIGIVLNPVDSIKAAKEGLDIWSKILIPSLLPFIIGANLIVDLKVVDIIGFIINPITKLIFNVSGRSALVFVISTVSGYPVGAKLASEYRTRGEISKAEAQRLLSFCSTSGPLFIIGSVGTGMFHNTALGYLMILCHYLGTITVGVIYRNYGWEILKNEGHSLKENIIGVVHSEGKRENFFVLFGNAVFNGVNTLLGIGGFVIVFSVVFRIFSIYEVIQVAAWIIHIPLGLLGVSMELCKAFISGLFEITIGCNKISQVSGSSQEVQAILASFLIGFSGLSILSQCCTFVSKTDVNIKHYVLCKFLHGLFAALFLFALYPTFGLAIQAGNFNVSGETIFQSAIWLKYMSYYSTILFITASTYGVTAIGKWEKTKYFIRTFGDRINGKY
ncbi:MAG: sporulation integral membrane protein YlbJ [Clostridioides sp.]|nr:sporulation integral membrane protein YlbJ [Clostridioides sp.]